MLRMILEQLWLDLERKKEMTDQDVRENLNLCMKLIPQEDDEPWVPEQAAAEDAASALAYAIRCRQSGDAQEAAWAARCAYEALDHFVIDQESIDTNVSGGEGRVLAHPLVQLELARQRRDLEELLDAVSAKLPSRITLIRERAKADSETVFKVQF